MFGRGEDGEPFGELGVEGDGFALVFLFKLGGFGGGDGGSGGADVVAGGGERRIALGDGGPESVLNGVRLGGEVSRCVGSKPKFSRGELLPCEELLAIQSLPNGERLG